METIVYLILKQEKMLVQQSKNSYIRTTKRYGYITNQLTRHDRCYDEFGADILTIGGDGVERQIQFVGYLFIR